MGEWESIEGLTGKAQSLYRQSWSLMTWVADNPDAGPNVLADVWGELERVERSLGNLTDREKFKEDLPAVAERLERIYQASLER